MAFTRLIWIPRRKSSAVGDVRFKELVTPIDRPAQASVFRAGLMIRVAVVGAPPAVVPGQSAAGWL
jgi:hypothetical protein